MAGGKKTAKKLTPEEWLKQALVPVEEQPYAVPGNWCWCNLLNMANIRTGKRDANYGCEDGQYYFFTCAAQPIRCVGYSFDCKAILLAGNGDISNISIYEGKFEAYQRTYVVEFLKPLISEYFYFFFKYRWFDYNKDKMYGTAIPYIRLRNLQRFPMAVAPLPEQRRIVALIEKLFAKLDEAREKAQAVLDGFELRRSAVLHKAFSGELTKRWRTKNNKSFADWKQIRFGELGSLERGRSRHRPRNDPKLFGGKYPFIQTGDVARSGMYVVEHSQTLNEAGMEQSRIFPKGTLCITIAANIGDVSILTYDCCFPDSVVGFIPNTLTSSEFIYYMMSTIQHKLEADAPATAQKNINLKILNGIIIKLPSLDEQNEIIDILERVFEKEQETRDIAETVINQIDIMKKSILSKAFHGELGTNNPDDENAAEHLTKMVIMK